ncbi:MAG: hypothetical protein WC023_04020 [Rhodocyclaceae bacterium]
MPNQINSTILSFLKAQGPRLDSEIADALKIPLTRVRHHVADLSSAGELICCNTIQFKDGARIEGISCRLSCYTPPTARGRKPGAAKRNTASEPLPE